MTFEGHAAFINSLSIANGHFYLAVSQDGPSTAIIFEIDPDKKSSRIAAQLKDIPSSYISAIPGFSVAADGHTLIHSRSKYRRATLYTANISR